jgi:glycosyltransferase involved in cell wall biosynthesis
LSVSEAPSGIRVAVVHEWLTEWGGSEDALLQILGCYPTAQLFATIDFLNERDRAKLGDRTARTTWLQRAPWVRKRFWNYLPVTGLAVESHDASEADILLTSSHAFAKGVLTHAGQLHVSYVYSPMRYAWDLQEQYLRDYRLDRGLKGLLARYMFHRLRAWDRQTSNNVDLFVAISRHVQRRIWRTYRRASLVIYPPVATQRFELGTEKDDYYVTVSRLVSYKRVDLMLQAFGQMPRRKLVVIGGGPELARLRSLCPPNVSLLGWQPDDVVQEHVRAARAFLFAAHEDFGIAPVEAQACGTPVIAYGVGGAAETVRDLGAAQPTGLLFARQTPEDMVDAIERFEQARGAFDPHACRAWAERFGEQRFRREFTASVEQAWQCWKRDPGALESAAGAEASSSCGFVRAE